jgi:ribosomal protein L7/L12
MSRIYILITLCLCIYIFMHTRFFKTLVQRLKNKSFPEKRNITMFDVRRRILKGDKATAIRLYCEIFQADLKEAQQAVDELAKSIHEKNELE